MPDREKSFVAVIKAKDTEQNGRDNRIICEMCEEILYHDDNLDNHIRPEHFIVVGYGARLFENRHLFRKENFYSTEFIGWKLTTRKKADTLADMIKAAGGSYWIVEFERKPDHAMA